MRAGVQAGMQAGHVGGQASGQAGGRAIANGSPQSHAWQLCNRVQCCNITPGSEHVQLQFTP
jgi:hypothetical protein